ncbi:hypothetical protein DEFDS_P208 (plasmid) [Deferribacter desulfuricans SSM1]|uniref:Uncharacterized protein n=1 Tax=Deferribacter desulfuricans (strain DSM 14783 / JCM 11476 / NBRC 101012 / SSM1) TaxID=639282 RepID=D3PF36_DEFDS|nr:hypothetical protein [Deferribacter desulfuricans]BAI81828.1 hypothetical protein DEFDS_P208 [Deferribacter desulfuricans SSM1]
MNTNIINLYEKLNRLLLNIDQLLTIKEYKSDIYLNFIKNNTSKIWKVFFENITTKNSYETYLEFLENNENFHNILHNNLQYRFNVISGKQTYFIDITNTFLLLYFYNNYSLNDLIERPILIEKNLNYMLENIPYYVYSYSMEHFFPNFFSPVIITIKHKNAFFELPFIDKQTKDFLSKIYSDIFQKVLLNNQLVEQLKSTLDFINESYNLQVLLPNLNNINYFDFKDNKIIYYINDQEAFLISDNKITISETFAKIRPTLTYLDFLNASLALQNNKQIIYFCTNILIYEKLKYIFEKETISLEQISHNYFISILDKIFI